MAIASEVKIEIDGKKLDDFNSLKIEQSIYGPSKFELICRHDSIESIEGFVIDKTKIFIGSSIVFTLNISMTEDITSSDSIFFKGIITNVRGTRSDYSDFNKIIISGKSPEFLLEDLPGCRSFENRNLKQIVEEVLKPYPKDLLKANIKPQITTNFEYSVQYNETSYDFLSRLSKKYGEWMYYDGTEFNFGPLNTKSKPEITMGLDQSEFDFGISMKPINFKIKYRDYHNNQTIENQSTKTTGKTEQNEVGGLAHDASAKHFSYQPQKLANYLNVTKDSYAKHLKEMSDIKEKAQSSGISNIEGKSVNPLLKLGGKVKIKALKMYDSGNVDYGEYIVTQLIHTINDLGTYTNLFKGVSAEATVPEYTDPDVRINCEPQSALVTDNRDPEKLGRIRVHFDWQEDGQSSPWIRIANPHSGVGRGVYFTPDIDDEVLVGFEGNNPEQPFVMGSLYNGKGTPNNEFPTNNNSLKGIMFNGLSLQFDESSGTTTIKTPDKKQITLSDQQKSIKIEDEKKNSIELSPDGIVFNTMKDLSITAAGNISVTAGKSMDIACGESMQTSAGQSIVYNTGAKFSVLSSTDTIITAGVNVSISGAASSELKGATTTIQGALVKIN